MSKKMWNKIFKSKSQKPQQPLGKINKRHSRGIYEEYQQLNDLLAGEKAQLNFSDQGQNEKENELGNGNGNGNGCGNGNGSINVFEQQPRQSSFNSLEFSEAHQQQLLQQQQQQQSSQQQQLSTFSRVRNTFSLRRGGNNNNKKQLLNAKSSESATPPEMGAATAINADATVTAAATTAAKLTNQSMQRVLIVVNKIDVATNHHQTNHLHASPTETATTAVKSTTSTATTDPGSDSMQGADEDPLPPPPPPLTTGTPLPEHAPPQSSGDLTPCPCCSRTFNLNALRKHIVICEKTSKKRKVFDSSRQRRDGTALSTYVLPKNFGLPNAERTVGVPSPPASVGTTAAAAAPAPAEPQSIPRSTARASLRKAASTVSNSSSTEAAPAAVAAPPPAPVRERSQPKRIKGPPCDRCPHCERTFNPKAFDRHVEWCKEKAIQANMKSGNSQETSKAKERLEARKQYKPPNLKTKRSVARDKYSSNHEELLEAGEMAAPKPNMMSQSMTSSVHSDNAKVIKSQRTSLPSTKEIRERAGTTVTQNQVTLDMSNDEDVASSPASSVRTSTSSRRLSKRKQYGDTSSQIDETMDRIKRNSLKQASLDCEDAPILQPVAKTRRAVIKRGKVEALDKELNLSNLPQVTMTFDELNGLIKRKGGTPICNMEMDEQEIATKHCSGASASMVRQARRRISTRENPSLGLQCLQQESIMAKNIDFGGIDCSLVPLQGSSNYSGSDDDDVDSPRAEMQIKLEATTMRTVCRPKKRSGHMLQNSEPMRALPMPGLKQSQAAISNKSTALPRLKLESERPKYEMEDEDGQNYNSDLDYDEEASFNRNRSLEDNHSDVQEEDVEEEPVLRLPPLVKQNSNMSRRLIVEQDEKGTVYIKSSPKPLRSGLGDKYDPFLSAKRQLEELCSPSTPPPEEEVTTNRSILTPTATATPSISMTTSLTTTGSSSKPIQFAAKTTTPTSNFRRTSSLRGPRRNAPLLNSRPLFATNYRPTIQRGLSDEGPISTNFLKPEEYDEMPVRAACGNDFHSPRVVRRDTSASNRKQPLKLPASGTNEGGNVATSSRTVAKTDSLAVFLKYEHELEQLNAKAAELATASQLTSKELKDKSNTLSKQNSAKNLGQSTPTQLPPLTPTVGAVVVVPPSPTTLAKENHYPPIATPLRLEPLSNKPSLMGNQQPPPLTPIKLESIFGPKRELGSVSGGSSVAGGDYIDPKLINACDNLHVNSGISSDASSTPQQLSQSRSRSSSQSTITHERRQSGGEARNLLKRKMRLGRNQFLYDASPEDADASSGCSADDEANRSSMEYDEQCWQQQQKQLLANPLPLVMPMVHSTMPTFDDFDFEEFLSSFENENDDEQFPLFKDCREFLLNRSTSRHRSFQKAATSTPQTATQPQINPQPHISHHQSKSKDNYTHATTHRSDALNMTSQSQPEERLQRQQSNASRTSSSHEEKQQSRFQEMERRAEAEDQQKREIFISIETEANAQGRSPISPESLRHMVGNPQTPIDVLHIENGNEPEHARFSKISDTEDAGHDSGDRTSQLGSNANTNRLAQSLNASTLAPNVQLNNAKNLMQQMQSDFRQLGEEASAAVRRQIMLNSGRSEDHQQQQQQQQFRDQEAGQEQQQHHHHSQQQQQQHHVKANSPLTPSPSADSDELSSLDGYPMSSSQSSRRGASSKLSSDSAYGSSNSPYSLSRQRSSELQPLGGSSHRSQGLLRPHTASAKLPSTTSDASTQAQTQYGTLKARQRLFGNGGLACGGNNGNGEGAESYSSESEENSQQPIQQQQQQQAGNYNYQQQQQQQQQYQPTYSVNNNNNNVPMTPTISQHSLLSNTSNNSMSSSMKMSKFCHECGAKFIIEHAKFCMDCGVRRMVL